LGKQHFSYTIYAEESIETVIEDSKVTLMNSSKLFLIQTVSCDTQ
jgi:hypothetical protein